MKKPKKTTTNIVYQPADPNLPAVEIRRSLYTSTSRGKKQPHWYAKWVHKSKLYQCSLGTPDRDEAYAVRSAKVEEHLREIVGKTDPSVRRISIEELLEEHTTDMAVSDTAKHIKMVKGRIQRVIAGLKAKRVQDLDPPKIRRWLTAEQKREPIPTKHGPHKPLSKQTCEYYWAHLAAWTGWARRNRRIRADRDPLLDQKFSARNGEHSATFDRRNFTETEYATLLKNSFNSDKTFRGLDGPARSILYLTARGTNFRAHELSTITPADIHASNGNGSMPYIELACSQSKRRRTDRQPISAALFQILQKFSHGKPKNEPLWGKGTWWHRAAEMMKKTNDLDGIEFETNSGGVISVLSFHSLRHTAITDLCRTNAPATEILKLARLSCTSLLMRYFHSDGEQRTAIINSLPTPKLPPKDGNQ